MRQMKKEHCKILDTYEDFSDYWTCARFKNVEEQVQLWHDSYMKKYPELFDKQVQNYRIENMDWQEIAKKIFRTLPLRIGYMHRARNNILAAYKLLCTKAALRLKLDFDIILVIHVGIGCGAGWATTYGGQPAILLGLENIAEQKWHTKNKLQGLISHEIGHLAHMRWRNEWENFEKFEEDPLFQLYSEGFAQRCEHIILKKETWHMAQNANWLSWCKQNKSWLAQKFLEKLRKHEPVREFFGSWFNIQGKTQTGYFLGHELVCELGKTYSLRETALLDAENVRKMALHYLNSISIGIGEQTNSTVCQNSNNKR
jgi:hypothetical protein